MNINTDQDLPDASICIL